MKTILAIDTSTDFCSVCLLSDSKEVFKGEHAPRKHAQLLMPMIHSVIEESDVNLEDVDAVAFGAGPGSFTGLRIAAGIAQGLAYGAGLPVIPISTLQAMADKVFRAYPQSYSLVALDARMGEVYWAAFRNQGDQLEPELFTTDPDQVCIPSMVNPNIDSGSEVVGAGSGFQFWQDFSSDCHDIVVKFDDALSPDALSVAKVAATQLATGAVKALPAEQAIPRYVRNDVAWKKLPGR